MRQVFVEKTVYEWSELSKEVQNKLVGALVEKKVRECEHEEYLQSSFTLDSSQTKVLGFAADVNLCDLTDTTLISEYFFFEGMIQAGDLLIDVSIQDSLSEIRLMRVSSCSSSTIKEFIMDSWDSLGMAASLSSYYDTKSESLCEELEQELKQQTTKEFFSDGTLYSK